MRGFVTSTHGIVDANASTSGNPNADNQSELQNELGIHVIFLIAVGLLKNVTRDCLLVNGGRFRHEVLGLQSGRVAVRIDGFHGGFITFVAIVVRIAIDFRNIT